jgi:hypothetical protein
MRTVFYMLVGKIDKKVLIVERVREGEPQAYVLLFTTEKKAIDFAGHEPDEHDPLPVNIIENGHDLLDMMAASISMEGVIDLPPRGRVPAGETIMVDCVTISRFGPDPEVN